MFRSSLPAMFGISGCALTVIYLWRLMHISHLSRACFYHLRQLRVVGRSLTMDSNHSLIRALVHSRVDYCNGVLAGQPQTQINILRAAARLVLQLSGWASVSNLMRAQLRWLSIPQRIQFKLCSVVYRCLHNTAPMYLGDLCVPISSLESRSHLRSAAAGDLRIPSAKTVTIGRRGFSVAGPAAWNDLTTTLKDYTLPFTAIKKLLKTELFKSM